jgi:XTP/dITP diphosphohydrolase
MPALALKQSHSTGNVSDSSLLRCEIRGATSGPPLQWKSVQVTVATRNPHKKREIQEILGPEFVVSDLAAHTDIPEISETGQTFEDNATLKAVAVSNHVPGVVLADDSGLEVDALDGAPGVLSARYAGEPTDDVKNLVKVLNQLRAVDPSAQRCEARFRCVLAIARSGKLLTTFDGEVEGHIVDVPRGSGGFGYDPIFVPVGFTQTFAELPAAIKNMLSHRSKAVAAARPFLKDALQTT